MNVDEILKDIEKEAKSFKDGPIDRSGRQHKDISLLERRRNEITLKSALQFGKQSLGKLRVIYRLPGVGYAFKTFVNLMRLTKRLQQLFDSIAFLHQLVNRLETEIGRVNMAVSFSMQQTSQLIRGVEKELVKDREEIHGKVLLLSQHYNDTTQAQAQMNDRVISQIQEFRATLAHLADQIGGNANDLNLDNFYYQFEMRFRGSEDEIRAKLKKYCLLLRKANTDFRYGPVLDLGFGRGEWLNLLREEGIAAIGVDSNAIMVNEGKARGLDVAQEDALTYLANRNMSSLSGITGFHIVEHLPFSKLIQLFDQAYRTLRPGGFIIFETPNPENLRVGSCNFYTDPTHRNPIPPQTLSFMAENRGFINISIERSSPIATSERITLPQASALSDWVNKEQDYALIAIKPHDEAVDLVSRVHIAPPRAESPSH